MPSEQDGTSSRTSDSGSSSCAPTRPPPEDPRPPWERARVAAGLDEPLPTIHSLRHTAATWWLAAGLAPHAAADLLGHVDPGLVIRLYGHALLSQRSMTGERMESLPETARR